MFITIQPEVYEDIFYQENIMAAHKIVTHLTLIDMQLSLVTFNGNFKTNFVSLMTSMVV